VGLAGKYLINQIMARLSKNNSIIYFFFKLIFFSKKGFIIMWPVPYNLFSCYFHVEIS
jgi:hypothetical protein